MRVSTIASAVAVVVIGYYALDWALWYDYGGRVKLTQLQDNNQSVIRDNTIILTGDIQNIVDCGPGDCITYQDGTSWVCSSCTGNHDSP